MHGITRYIEDLVRSRRPKRFRVAEEDTDLARTAITLRAARPGSGAPAEEFVTALHKKLAAELDSPADRPAMGGRRTFLRVATATGAVVGAAAAGAGIDHALTSPSAPAAESTLMPDHPAWFTVAASVDLPEGTVRRFTAGAVTCFVQRTSGRLHAVSGICTHQGCLLTLAADPTRLACPCHGATFALDGAVLTHHFRIPLAKLPELEVREVHGTVQVLAPAPAAE